MALQRHFFPFFPRTVPGTLLINTVYVCTRYPVQYQYPVPVLYGYPDRTGWRPWVRRMDQILTATAPFY